MKFINLIFAISIFAFSASAQKYTVSGYITDLSNGETIIGANIFCKELGLGTTANTYGFYSLTYQKEVMRLPILFWVTIPNWYKLISIKM